MAELNMADVLAGLTGTTGARPVDYQPPQSWADLVKGAQGNTFARMPLDLAESIRKLATGEAQYYPGLRREDYTDDPTAPQPNAPFINAATDVAGLMVGSGPGSTGSVGSGAAYRQGFAERMLEGQDAALRARTAPAYVTARAPTVTDEFKPLLRSGETRGDVARAMGAEPLEESLADVARRAYREALDPGFTLGSGSKKAAPIVAAPTILKPDRPLFDLSKLGEVPNVPQFDLPRWESKLGVPEDIERLASKSNIARVNRGVEAGLKQGGIEWYNSLPLKEAYLAELGIRKGTQAYHDYIDAIGATSPTSDVLSNIRNASYYNWLLQQGESLPKMVQTKKGNWSVPPGEIPPPYGGIGQATHVRLMKQLEQTGDIPFLEYPKATSFIQNLLGNYRPVTIDRHNLSLWGSGRETPGAGYGFLEQLQQDQARRLGIAPAQYQAGGWIDYGRSGGASFMALLDQVIGRTAAAQGLPKEQVLREFLRGNMPLQ